MAKDDQDDKPATDKPKPKEEKPKPPDPITPEEQDKFLRDRGLGPEGI